MIVVHDGKQVAREGGWVSPRKVVRHDFHGFNGSHTGGGSISNRFDLLSQMEEETQMGRIILATPIDLLPRVETHETLVEPSEGPGNRFSLNMRTVKVWIRKGKERESQVDIGNSELQKMLARIEAGNPSIVGVEFVIMLKE